MCQESSGWLKWIGNDANTRTQYVTEYEQKEGVKLDIAKIKENPGRCSLAKLLFSSFWGKSGFKENKRQVQAYISPAEF